ncbi:MAG TPA: YdcF family protein [Actinocatenispora sp.]
MVLPAGKRRVKTGSVTCRKVSVPDGRGWSFQRWPAPVAYRADPGPAGGAWSHLRPIPDRTRRAADAALVLGCHDLGVADTAAELYHAGLAPVLVCSGATNPLRPQLFPHGEAAAFADRLRHHGVPDAAILTEPAATNTGATIALSRRALAAAGIQPATVALVCMPYMQRRAHTTCQKLWPQVDAWCASTHAPFADYVARIGDPPLVIDHMVGDLQRITYPARGYAIAQTVPRPVMDAYRALIASGHTSRMLTDSG